MSGDTVEAAVRRDIAGLRKRAPELADSALAVSALALARGIDDFHNSLTSRTMAARELRETLNRLLELAPDAETGDTRIDALGAKAAAKLLN